MMKHGIYSEDGDVERLRMKGALLMQDPNNNNNYMAQFDALYLPEAFGWHSFPKVSFVNIRELSGE